MKFATIIAFAIALTSSISAYAIPLKQCVGKTAEVTSAYQNCINSNLEMIKAYYAYPVFACEVMDNSTLDSSYQECININFSIIKLFLNLKDFHLKSCAHNNQEDSFYPYYECVNINFEKVLEELSMIRPNL